MPVSNRLRELAALDKSEDTTVSWPATRLLGLLAEHHFLAVVEALEQRDPDCEELAALEALLAAEGEPYSTSPEENSVDERTPPEEAGTGLAS